MTDRLDDDGYPTDSALEALERFEGNANELLAYVRTIFDGGYIRETKTDESPSTPTKVEFITNGWSGAESVISSLEKTMFYTLFWQSSHRGGLHVYEIRPQLSEMPRMGDPTQV